MRRSTQVDEEALAAAYATGDPHAIAAVHGLDVVVPAADELLIDIDDQASLTRFAEAFPLVSGLDAGWKVVRNTPSKSANGPWRRHIVVKAPWALSAVERVAWQAALGSDLKRAVLELLGIRGGKATPTCFFEVRT